MNKKLGKKKENRQPGNERTTNVEMFVILKWCRTTIIYLEKIDFILYAKTVL